MIIIMLCSKRYILVALHGLIMINLNLNTCMWKQQDHRYVPTEIKYFVLLFWCHMLSYLKWRAWKDLVNRLVWKCSYTAPCKYIGNADIHPVIIGLLLYTIIICTTSNDCSNQPSVCANCSYMCNDRNTNMLPDLQFPENTHKATGVHSK